MRNEYEKIGINIWGKRNLLFENLLVIICLILPLLISYFSIPLLDFILGKPFKLFYKDIVLIVLVTIVRNLEVVLAMVVSDSP